MTDTERRAWNLREIAEIGADTIRHPEHAAKYVVALAQHLLQVRAEMSDEVP